MRRKGAERIESGAQNFGCLRKTKTLAGTWPLKRGLKGMKGIYCNFGSHRNYTRTLSNGRVSWATCGRQKPVFMTSAPCDRLGTKLALQQLYLKVRMSGVEGCRYNDERLTPEWLICTKRTEPPLELSIAEKDFAILIVCNL